ncbi:MAG: hypothetical protein LBR60_08310 [Fibrobacter sp.]|jgi:hypothetical protein|nr:hypothetical protein [Fibrobacter sp.]
MLKQIFGIVLLATASLFAQEWDGSWETAIEEQEQNTVTVRNNTPEPMEKNAALASEAAMLREEGMAQRSSGNTFLGVGIAAAAVGLAVYIAGEVNYINEYDSCYDDGYYYDDDCEDNMSGTSAALILSGSGLGVTGAVFITIGIVKKAKGSKKIRRADNLERMAFGFTPIIDIPNGRAGGVFTAAF